MSDNELKDKCNTDKDDLVKSSFIVIGNLKIKDMLRGLNKILMVSTVIATILSLGLSQKFAMTYISIEKLPVSVYSVFIQIMPILFLRIGAIGFAGALLFVFIIFVLFAYAEMSKILLTGKPESKWSLYFSIALQSSVLVIFSIAIIFINTVINFKNPYMLDQVFLAGGAGYFALVVLILSGLRFRKTYKTSPEPIFKFPIFALLLYLILACTLWWFFSPLGISDRHELKFLIKFIVIPIVFVGFAGYLYGLATKMRFGYRDIILRGCVGGVVLLVILWVLIFETFVTGLVGGFLEVRVSNSQCVMLYQKSDLGNDNKRMQENSSPDSYSLYKINGSSELRIPLQADGMFYASQCEKDNENECVLGQFSDIYIIPVSSVTSIRACPKLPENTKYNSAVAR